MCPRPFGRGRLRPAGLFMPRARPCGRARLCSAPTTPYAARETFQARATRARATDHGAVHGAQRPRQTCAMRRSSSRARLRATQCESERSTTGAMGEGAASEPLPGAIQDAVAAAIEDGATMDEIVACVRARGGDRSPLIPRARRCARARPAEGRWAERMDGPDLPAARDRSLCRGLGAHARPPRRRAQRAHRNRDPANAGAVHDGRAWPARGAGADRGPRPSRARALPHRERRQAPHRARADDGRCRRARRAGRARGQYDACRTGRDRPPGS